MAIEKSLISSIKEGGNSNARNAILERVHFLCACFINAMKTRINSVIIHKSWVDAIAASGLSDRQKLFAFYALFNYAFFNIDNGNPIVDIVRDRMDFEINSFLSSKELEREDYE